NAPVRHGWPRRDQVLRRRYIGQRSLTIVAEQTLPGRRSVEQIEIPVVVHVGERNAPAEAGRNLACVRGGEIGGRETASERRRHSARFVGRWADDSRRK